MLNHAVFFLCLAGIASAFGAPAEVSAPGANASSPWLAVVGNIAHAAWAECGAENCSVMYANTTSGGDMHPIEIAASESAPQVRIASDAGGNLAIVWKAQTAFYYSISTDRGLFWSPAAQIPGTEAADGPFDFAAGANGTAALVWVSGGNLSLSKFIGGTWKDPGVLDYGTAGQPRIAANPKGGYGIVWTNGSSGEIQFMDTPSGREYDVSNTVGNSEAPDIAFDTSGTAHIAWRDANDTSGSLPGQWDVWYAQFSCTCSGIKEKKDISNTPGSASYAPVISADQHDNIHAIWADNATGTLSLFYSKSSDGGAGWSSPLPVQWTADSPEAPFIAADGEGRPHILWEATTPSGHALMHAGWNGSAWVGGENISTSASPIDYSAAIDGMNRLHTLFAAGGKVYYALDQGFGRSEERQLRLAVAAEGCIGQPLAIRATDESGNPIANTPTTVSLYSAGFEWSEVEQETTDFNGSASFTPPVSGYYKISIEKLGYPLAVKYATISDCGAVTPTPGASVTPTPETSVTSIPSATPTPAPTPTSTATETPTPVPTATPLPTASPSPTPAPQPSTCPLGIALLSGGLFTALVRN